MGKPPPENTFINSLIHEYLSFNGMPGTARMLALGEAWRACRCTSTACTPRLAVCAAESGLHAEERLPREFLAHSLGLESDATLQEAEDLPLLYGAVGQLQAARRAAVTAGLVPTAEQPTVPPLTTAQREEVDSLAAAMARAYKADAARELARATAPAVREAAPDDRDGAPRHGDTRGGTSGDEGGEAEGGGAVGIGYQGGGVGRPVRGGLSGTGGRQPEAGDGSGEEGAYSDDEFEAA